jgi:predicted amidohydrolase YtcJ
MAAAMKVGDRRQRARRAEILLQNGAIYTGGPRAVWAEALAIGGGRILAAGKRYDVQAYAGSETEVIDLGKRMALPGFFDAHIHPIDGGVGLIRCDLTGLDNLGAYKRRILEYAALRPEQKAILGGGWSYSSFSAEGPHRRDLDELVTDRPVFLTAIDGHSAWANSKALALAGISAHTADPPGGLIERDAAGQPTGTLREQPAMNLVQAACPSPTFEELLNGAKAFLAEAARAGITGVHDARADRRRLEVYRELERRGELTARVTAALECDPVRGMEQIPEFLQIRRDMRSALVSASAAKIFLDGVVEGHTAWLSVPYEDRPDSRGILLWPEDRFREMVSALDHQGFQIQVHAIGDAAIRLALEAFEQARRINGSRDSRHQIAHLDLISPADIRRLADLQVIASVQPGWAYLDNLFFDTSLPFLGKDRAESMYPFRTLVEAGARLACGTDWPYGGDLATLRPLDSVRVGVTRRGIQSGFAPPYLPAESLDLWSMLDGHTWQAAYAHFQDAAAGSLEAGKSADLIVLDQDLRDMPTTEIHKANVLLTLFEGRTVFREPAF